MRRAKTESHADRAGEGEAPDAGRASGLEGRGSFGKGGASRHHVVDQQHRASAHELRMRRGKSAADVLPPRLLVESPLSAGTADAAQLPRIALAVDALRQRRGEIRGLVVAAVPAVKSRDRHRHHEVDLGHRKTDGQRALQPVREVTDQMKRTIELVVEDHLPRQLVEGDRARRAVEARLRRGTPAVLAEILALKPLRRASADTAAALLRHERKPLETGGTEIPRGTVDGRAADLAATRKDQVGKARDDVHRPNGPPGGQGCAT